MEPQPLDPITNRHCSRRSVIGWSSVGLAAALLATTGVSMTARAQSPPANQAQGDFAGLVDIGGRSLYMESAGAGSPTVVLIAGALGRGDVWSRDQQQPEGARQMVFPAVASFTHVIEYDRPGTIGEVNHSLDPNAPLFYPSRSDDVPQPRTGAEFVQELHDLLQAADVPGPYVLVGHSVGGLYAQLYAMSYPDEVVGMVLVDATNEEVWEEFHKALTPEQWVIFERNTVRNEELLAAYPPAEMNWTAPLLEDPTVEQVRQARKDSPVRSMPLYTLTHGIPFGEPFPGWPGDEMEAIMRRLQEVTLHQVPNSKHVIATESGHNIHQDQPELVIEAIRAVVDAVRDPSTWTS
jgi:pimeloyl-ACP methyl ester carboxylesterase